ncbi:hypothetical protein JYU19_02010 [bacterium AH-315-J21]|nr:hypothetical protein [bacterium AH-315-J21]
MNQLEKCLTGITPKGWLKLLNGKVFLWPDFTKVQELSNARAYRDKSNCLIALNTNNLLKHYGDAISLTPINVGATLYKPAERSPSIFSSVNDFPKRKKTDKVKEVTINHSIMSISKVVNSVHTFRNGRCIKRIL